MTRWRRVMKGVAREEPFRAQLRGVDGPRPVNAHVSSMCVSCSPWPDACAPADAPVAQPAGAAPVETRSVSPPSVHESPTGIGVETGTGPVTTGTEVVGRRKRVALTFEATREQVFKAFPAIANLADKSDAARVRIRIEGSSAAGFDPSWLRNAVDEPLYEADIERTSEEWPMETA